jgi:hypothetical protein
MTLNILAQFVAHCAGKKAAPRWWEYLHYLADRSCGELSKIPARPICQSWCLSVIRNRRKFIAWLAIRNITASTDEKIKTKIKLITENVFSDVVFLYFQIGLSLYFSTGLYFFHFWLSSSRSGRMIDFFPVLLVSEIPCLAFYFWREWPPLVSLWRWVITAAHARCLQILSVTWWLDHFCGINIRNYVLFML